MSPISVKPTSLGTAAACIYCGSPGTSQEHLIPKGFNGPYTLEKASCAACAAMTSDFERQMLRGPLMPVRIILDMYTRDPKDRPKALPLRVTFEDGHEEEREVPAEFHPCQVALPLFFKPPFLDGKDATTIMIREDMWSRQFTDPEQVSEYVLSIGGTGIIYESNVPTTALAQLVSKIAYGFVIGQLGTDGLKERYLPSFLPEPDFVKLAPYFGGYPVPRPAEDALHLVGVEIREDRLVSAAVRLLARFGAPTYVVIVGRARDDARTGTSWYGTSIEPNHPVVGYDLPTDGEKRTRVISASTLKQR